MKYTVMKTQIRYMGFLFLLAALLIAAGCGVSGDTANGTATTPITGRFVDSAVSGLSYSCSSGISGITNPNGEFSCDPGDSISFSINGFTLGTTTVAALITPNTLTSDTVQALNITQLLQTLDIDNDLSNGISIAQFGTLFDAMGTMAGANIMLDQADFDTVAASYLTVPLVSEASAQLHLNDCLSGFTFNMASIKAAFAGKTLYPSKPTPAWSEEWVVAADGVTVTGGGVDQYGAYSGSGTLSYTDTSFTFISNDPSDAPVTFTVISISDSFIDTNKGKVYYTQAEAYTDAIRAVFAGHDIYPQQASPTSTEMWTFEASASTVTISGSDQNGSFTQHANVTYNGATFSVINQDVGNSNYLVPVMYTVVDITPTEIRIKDAANVETSWFYSATGGKDKVVGIGVLPSNAVTLVRDFANLSGGSLPDLLGGDTLYAYYGDGSNEALACYGHHYNSAINENVLHCTSPSRGTAFYFGMSSSNTNVIAIQNDGVSTTWWQPVNPGNTVITGKLLFTDTALSFDLQVTLNAL